MKTPSAERPLTSGNSAKLYCLQWIEQRVKTHETLTILDLGCGAARNFVLLLERYPGVKYVGIEPSASDCQAARDNLAGHNATIINAYAYDVFQQVNEQFDVVISFSVLEHVYQRQRYLDNARDCLKPDGSFLINYDAGHFVHPRGAKERIKNRIGPILARAGIEAYYQSFVPEDTFHAMIERAGLEIVEMKSFNTALKGIHKLVPSHRQDEHMQRWLDYELWLNNAEIPYRDALAGTWVTRNFILRRKP